MVEASAFVLPVLSIVTFGWAVVGLIKPELARLPHRLASVGVWAISFAMFVFAMTLSSGSSDRLSDAGVASAPPRVVSQEELLQAFKENEVRAEQTYAGQRLQLTGHVDSVRADEWGGGSVDFRGGSLEILDGFQLREVTAHFDDGSVLTDLSSDQRITVVCGSVEGGNVMGVRLRDCEFARTETSGTAAVSEAPDGAPPSRTAGREMSESSDEPPGAGPQPSPRASCRRKNRFRRSGRTRFAPKKRIAGSASN